MGWPTDPEKRALAAQRHREAQRARWGKNEERERLRALAAAQWTPEKRAEMSALKRRQYAERPELRATIAAHLRAVVPSPAVLADAVRQANRRKRTLKAFRLAAIRARMAHCANGAT